jgi:protein-S-isoprenylcysteine O-methyltransferase Ste14
MLERYVGFVLIISGFLVPRPTLVMLAMFPILVTMYALPARREEREAKAELGDEYRHDAMRTLAFLPTFAVGHGAV